MKLNGKDVSNYLVSQENGVLVLGFTDFKPTTKKSATYYKRTIAPLLRGQSYNLAHDAESSMLTVTIQLEESEEANGSKTQTTK